jgi:antitoxin (DNA-binding transcriptional repressor) of toxin-antitoxin stability system
MATMEGESPCNKLQVSDAQSRLPGLINEAVGGETAYIVGNGEQVVQLVPVVTTGRPRFGSAAGLISMAEDFDTPLEDFSEYMQVWH